MTKQSHSVTLFFYNDTATTEFYTLSLHDALPIFFQRAQGKDVGESCKQHRSTQGAAGLRQRSEEHTSELQSLAYLVCRLLLEKKNKNDEEHVYFYFLTIITLLHHSAHTS